MYDAGLEENGCGVPKFPSPKSRCTVTDAHPAGNVTAVLNETSRCPEEVHNPSATSVCTFGQQLQMRVVVTVSEQGVGSMHVAVMVTGEPQGHFDSRLETVQFEPLTTAAALEGAIPAQPTVMRTLLLAQFATVPLSEMLVTPGLEGEATMEAGLIETVHMMGLPRRGGTAGGYQGEDIVRPIASNPFRAVRNDWVYPLPYRSATG